MFGRGSKCQEPHNDRGAVARRESLGRSGACHGGDDSRSPGRDEARTVGISPIVGRALGTVVVTLKGELDGSGSSYLAAILDDLIDGQGNLDVGIDLRSVGSIDHASVEALAVAGHQLARHGGQLSLARPIPAVREVLAATGLAGLIVGPQPPKAQEPSGGGNRPTPPSLHPAGSNYHRESTNPPPDQGDTN